MAESIKLLAHKRDTTGSRQARRLRLQGGVPGVVYGHQEATVIITLQGEDLYKAIRLGARVVDLEQDGKVEKALIRELQWDPLGHDILHVDFARVAADQRITVDVRLELRGTSPGVTAGGILDQPIHNLKVECLALSVPESLRVNISSLQLNEALHVRDLVLPPDVVVKADPDAIVVQVKPPLVEEEAAAPAAAQAEPEIIGRKPAEAEEEGE